jgi:uroporphyrinogen-III synthase
VPLLVHETLDTGLPDPDGFAALALTSANALRALEERDALKPYLELQVFAVGDHTAAAATARGFSRVSSAGGTFADLVELLAHAGLVGPVFYPAARDQSGDLGRSLASHGVMVITTPVYAMQAIERLPDETLGELQSGAIDAALFYSRRTAAAFAELCGDRLPPAARDRFGVLCLSEAVAEPLLDAHFVRVGLADHPSEEGMMGLALSFARDQNPS